MSCIFLRRRILKNLRDKELQRYGWQVLASIPVLLWPRFIERRGLYLREYPSLLNCFGQYRDIVGQWV
jgi:hypothetical protein